MSIATQQVDWLAEGQLGSGKWENHGRTILFDSCTHPSEEQNDDTNARYNGWCKECGIGETSAEPMLDYIYPLELENPSEEKILQVVKRTACTVFENTETGEWFIALCGAGMDMSQDIALAYIILEKWIPCELITSVSTQKGLTVSGTDWELLRTEAIEQADHYAHRYQYIKEQWEKTEQ